MSDAKLGIFSALARIQGEIAGPMTAWVDMSYGYDMAVLRLEARNPGHAFALLDAAGSLFGEADAVDGCGSCGFGSAVEVSIQVVEEALASEAAP